MTLSEVYDAATGEAPTGAAVLTVTGIILVIVALVLWVLSVSGGAIVLAGLAGVALGGAALVVDYVRLSHGQRHGQRRG